MADKSGIVVEMDRRQKEELMKAMDVISSQTEIGVKKVIAQGVIDIHRDTISPGTFPVVTGALRASYLVEVKDMQGSVYSEIDYAAAVEDGIGQPAQPYLIPAYRRNLPRIDAAIDKLLKGVLR
jgi:hypothetical protein